MSGMFIRIFGVVLMVSLLSFPTGAMAAPETSGETIHIVQWGETLSLIASHYDVTVEAIMAANGLHDPNSIYVGQRLIIPTAGPASGGCTDNYTVKWGDTLSGIAWHYGTTSSALMHANGFYSDLIYEGQRLCVPPGDEASRLPAQPDEHTYYTVRPGDTLAAIALHFGVSQAAITQANNLSNPSLIYVGGRLLIPGVYAIDATMSKPPKGAVPPSPQEYPPQGSHGPPPQGAPASPPEYSPDGPHRPGGPTGDQSPQTAPAPPPQYQPQHVMPGLARSTEPVVVRSESKWTGSQMANNPDPDEITTLVVMTHEGTGLDVMIRSMDGFVARGVTGVYYEYSWIPTFAFRNIPHGEYEVWVEGQPSKIVKAKVDPGYRAWVEFKWKLVSEDLAVSPAGWIGEVVDNTSGNEPIGAFSILVVRTGAVGNKIRVTAPGGYEAICITGTKPEHGPGACDVGGLNAGTYQVILDGADIAVELYLDGIGTATVEFRPAANRMMPVSWRDP